MSTGENSGARTGAYLGADKDADSGANAGAKSDSSFGANTAANTPSTAVGASSERRGKTAVNKGIVGNSGLLSYKQLLELALRSSPAGTLTVRYPNGLRAALFEGGKVKRSFETGQTTAADGVGVDFHLQPHGESDLPQLGSGYPKSIVGPLQALPLLGPAEPLPTALVDLREFVARARVEELTGALTVETEAEAGVALIHEGRIGAALYDKSGHVWERSDALRGFYRYSLDQTNPPMLLHRLDPDTTRSLLGMALDRRVGGGDPNSFNGVSSGEGGYTFYCAGRAFLHVAAPHEESGGRFGQLEAVPDLELPDDPPGWESRRFDLTLRGSDALNPMTDLSMEFNDGFGPKGRRILEAVRRGLTIEEIAAHLGVELTDLKPWLQRLEGDGLIRLRP